ncbi:AAA family ATPase [Streptomyces sp. NPDC059828]|uniref:AAA family ATPase n=1 Tax=Streptomyces sp. NPDC059828 TaxID=3346965 RepID=UPI00364E25A7
MEKRGAAVRFMIIDRDDRMPAESGPVAVLVRDAWDDFGWRTMFHLWVIDARGRHEIGPVKIGALGMSLRAETVVQPPEEFTRIPGEYFSVGQDDTYYERLAGLGDGLRIAVLAGLNDMAFDEDVFQLAQGEEVTRTALWRFLRPAAIEEQFRRIARGGARTASFDVTYVTPAFGGDGLALSFRVTREVLPPSNIHVLTGRNGAGKSVLVNRLARAVADLEPHPAEVGRILEEDRGGRRSFANLVSVSFSAFDDLPHLPDSDTFPTVHVGLRIPSATGAHRMKSPSQLKRDFADSIEACLNGEQAVRWTEALRTLSYSGSGLLEEDWLASFAAIGSTARRRTAARKLFASLSSGHKVVLLTVTRLVEHVGERTLVLIDEPETHLHPPLLSAFIRVLSDLLTDRNGLAIVATHSPVVLQEVPAHCVWKLRRYGDRLAADRPTIETFGENVGVLTHEVFGLEVTDTGFHRDLSVLVDEGLTYETIVDRFGGRLGGEARIIARSLIAARDFDDTAGLEDGR